MTIIVGTVNSNSSNSSSSNSNSKAIPPLPEGSKKRHREEITNSTQGNNIVL